MTTTHVPSRYFHIGGDEVKFPCWNQSTAIRKVVSERYGNLSSASFELLQGLSVAPTGSQAPRHSMMLHALAARCEGLSGRALRKLPFLAHANLIAATATVGLEAYLDALHRAVELESNVRAELESS